MLESPKAECTVDLMGMSIVYDGCTFHPNFSNTFSFSDFFFSCRLKRCISCPPHTESFYSMIILRRTYLGGIKFVSTLSPRPKKMMGELAMSLVKKDVSNFMSK